MEEFLSALNTKKTHTRKVIQPQQRMVELEDSIDNYPDIKQLEEKYGKNNLLVERMKLRYDQACLLGERYQDDGGDHSGDRKKLYELAIVTVNGISGPLPTDLQVSHTRTSNNPSKNAPPLSSFLIDLNEVKAARHYIQDFNKGDSL